MPNICFTKYAIKGDKDKVTYLYKKMRSLRERKTNYLPPSPFAKTRLHKLLEAIGAPSVLDNCWGDWDTQSLRLEEDGTLLLFSTNTEWRRCLDLETAIRLKFGDKVSIFFLEEENGNDIWLTNDQEGKYFPERVMVVDEEKDKVKYLSEQDALCWLNKRLEVNSNNPTWDEMGNALDAWNKQADKSCIEKHIYFHKVKLDD